MPPTSPSQEQAALASLDEPALLALLADLVSFPSVANREGPVQEHMARVLAAAGMQVDVWDIDFSTLRAHPAYAADVERESGLGLVGTAGGDGEGPTLILNGHVDVVPAGDLSRWTAPPFALTEREGRLYGRGVVDMKGALACAVAAVGAIGRAGVPLEGRVQIQSVIGEEDGGAGTLATLLRGHGGDAAIVLEPTRFVVSPSQAGALSFRIVVPGRAAHGAFREEGVDPVERFVPVFHALRSLEEARNRDVSDPLFRDDALPFAITMGRLTAGIWPSTVAEELSVEGRFGVAPGEDLDSARSALEDAVRSADAPHPWAHEHPARVEWWGAQFAPARTDPAHPLVGALSTATAEISGEPPGLAGVRFGSDMRLLVNEGGIPTVLFGPGDVREAHRPDESVDRQDLVRASRILILTILRYCGVAVPDR